MGEAKPIRLAFPCGNGRSALLRTDFRFPPPEKDPGGFPGIVCRPAADSSPVPLRCTVSAPMPLPVSGEFLPERGSGEFILQPVPETRARESHFAEPAPRLLTF